MKKTVTDASESCPVCDSGDLHSFVELSHIPAQDGIVYASMQAAIDAPVGDINLAVCRQCHFIGNLAHDAGRINFAQYSYSKYHSPQYRKHVAFLVTMLTDKYSIQRKKITDVGCGEGFFLNELCKGGENYGVGIDPSYTDADRFPADDTRLEFIKAFYTSEHARYESDLICCRHLIDELDDPVEMMRLVTATLGPDGDGLVYIEVPNALQTFEKKLIWNIGYAKRSWFTAKSLQALLHTCGLEVLSARTLFGNEYLGIVARRLSAGRKPLAAKPQSDSAFLGMLDEFAEHLSEEILRWQEKIAQLRLAGEQMVIWGAGMRGINFLHHFGDLAVFPKIVDINADRQGHYLPGSGYLVEPPEALRAFQPGRILLSNPNYTEEILTHIEEMGLDCEIELL